MHKRALVYGAIAGAVIIGINTASFELGVGHVWLGYLVMLIAFSVIFVALKQYRDEELGGVMPFRTGFLLGLGITLAASVVYVAVWELYLAATDYRFIDVYIESVLAEQRASGASAAELEATIAATETIREQYGNAMFRLPMTFIEIFPVGLIVSLIAALILRDRRTLPAGNA